MVHGYGSWHVAFASLSVVVNSSLVGQPLIVLANFCNKVLVECRVVGTDTIMTSPVSQLVQYTGWGHESWTASFRPAAAVVRGL